MTEEFDMDWCRIEEARLSSLVDSLPQLGKKLAWPPPDHERLSQEALCVVIRLDNWDENQDTDNEYLDVCEETFCEEIGWLSVDEDSKESLTSRLEIEESDVRPEELDEVDVIDLLATFKNAAPVTRLLPLSTKTFVRPKKGRSSIGATGSPKIRRKLTTTIVATPELIPALELLSRTNNRPVSSSGDMNWEDGAQQADVAHPVMNSEVPASVLQRLQELKASNMSINRGNISINNRTTVQPTPLRANFQLGNHTSYRLNESHSVAQNGRNESAFRGNESMFRNAMNEPFAGHNGSVLRNDRGMSISQLLREAPDFDADEPESLLSLGDNSLMQYGEMSLSNFKGILEDDRRMTFGGIALTGMMHPATAADAEIGGVEKLFDQNGHFIDRRATMGGMNLPIATTTNTDLLVHNDIVAEDKLVSWNSPGLDEDFLNMDDNNVCLEENGNLGKKLAGTREYSSQLFDTTFAINVNKENKGDACIVPDKGVDLDMFPLAGQNGVSALLNGKTPNWKSAFVPIDKMSATFTPPDTHAKNNATYTPESLAAALQGTCTPPLNKTVVVSASTPIQGKVQETFVKDEKEASTPEPIYPSKLSKSREELQQYMTYTRPRMSPARSGLPMRRMPTPTQASTEDLARSPSRSDGSTTPVEGRSDRGTYTRNSHVLGAFTRNSPVAARGTYTRNSPVERCGSEDERMSTTSDQSQESIDELVDRFKSSGIGTKKRATSTPRNSSSNFPEDLNMTPISSLPKSAASSIESLTGRGGKTGAHGPAPLKPALIRPSGTFRLPQKKSETPSSQAPGPMRSGAVKPTGVPTVAGRGIPSRIPATRLSSIPRPGSSRLSTLKKP